MKKTIATMASFAFLFVVAVPAHAGTISGNGAGSYNKIKVSQSSSSTLVQSNKAKYNNTVVVSTSTGGNKANKNTGGDVTVTTGDASSVVDITNTANINNAVHEGGCGCGCLTPLDIAISGNGAHSWNTVSYWSHCSDVTSQWNSAYISNGVVTSNSTGGNSSNANTGGSVEVSTGGSSSEVTITNTANSNTSL